MMTLESETKEELKWTSITIPVPLRNELKEIKIIDEEPWYKVIQRLVSEHKRRKIR